MGEGDIGSAIRPAIGPLLEDVSSGAALDLKTAKFVHEEEIGGETHYLLGPPDDVLAKVEDALFAVQLVASNSYWLRPLGLAIFAFSLAALAYLSRRDRAALANRLGLVLIIGGSIAFLGWLIGVPILQGIIKDAAFEGREVPSEAFHDLATDVLNRAVSNLTPYIWLPALVAAGMGVALVVLARFVLPRPLQPRIISAARY
jgi:hypothetical protein